MATLLPSWLSDEAHDEFLSESDDASDEHDDGDPEDEEHHDEHSYCFPKFRDNPKAQHTLPVCLKIIRTLCIASSIATIATVMILAEVVLINYKFKLAQDILDFFFDRVALGVALCVAFLCVASGIMVSIAAGLVAFLNPLAAGSGLPELKGYLNGNVILNLYGTGFNWVRMVGAILATGAGLPVDREGPLISIGGAVGVGITRYIMGRFYKNWAQTDADAHDTELLLMDEESFARVKRTGAILGAAGGLAVAYNAPVAGVLYMLEEVTLSSWPEKLTVTAAVVTVVAVVSAMFIYNNVLKSEIHTLVIFQHGVDITDMPWTYIDLLFTGLVVVLVGILSSVFSCGLLQVWRIRHRKVAFCSWPRGKCARIVEAALFAALCAVIFNLVPVLGKCTTLPDQDLLHGRIFVRYTCPEGQYNQLASLFMQGEEGAVKTLFARDTVMEGQANITKSDLGSSSGSGSGSGSSSGSDRRLGGSGSSSGSGDGSHDILVEEYSVATLLIALVVYFPFSVATAGLALPMGYFVPSMFIGALTGRAAREAVTYMGIQSLSNLAHPGIYALLGSAVALSSYTHMSLAIVVLLVENSKVVNLIVPLLVAVLLGRMISRHLIRHPYDEQLIIEKGVPFLEVECPHFLDSETITAGSKCIRVPREGILRKSMEPAEIQKALAISALRYYPVVDERQTRCIGIASRRRLQSALYYDPADRDLTPSLPVDESQDAEQLHRIKASLRSVASSDDGGRRRPGCCDLGDLEFQSLTLPPEAADEMEILKEPGVGERRITAGLIDVMLFADPAPLCVLETTPIVRIYSLFSRANIAAVCVLSNSHQVAEMRNNGKAIDDGQQSGSSLTFADLQQGLSYGTPLDSQRGNGDGCVAIAGILSRRELTAGTVITLDEDESLQSEERSDRLPSLHRRR